ncbi:hypothetical protein LCGC14_1328020 [marine sediment metagenome]|uniref:2-hydroxyacid dehydrogenase n=2 Tax=root TaxID=1 RepID=A0A831QSG9_9FLAO|nr:2-hydroxyacid dehydrogenase [Pricia antarctica]
MKIAIYSYHDFEEKYIEAANSDKHELIWIEETMTSETLNKAKGCKAVCIFSSDKANEENLTKLKELGVELIATRSAGTDHIDLEAAEDLDIKVVNVPSYSPNAIAEHCIALTLALFRKLKPSFERIGNYNFSLSGQVGTEIRDKTIGICGTGDIGEVLAHLFHGFGAEVLLFDAKKNKALSQKGWAKYVDKNTLLERCDVISLNLPFNEDTDKFIATEELKAMKKTAILINTGRGRLVDTAAVLKALQEDRIAGFGMDVYENEKGIFLKNLSDSKDKDKLLASLIAMNNVVVTSHQAFLTHTALSNMMKTTFESIEAFENGGNLDTAENSLK